MSFNQLGQFSWSFLDGRTTLASFGNVDGPLWRYPTSTQDVGTDSRKPISTGGIFIPPVWKQNICIDACLRTASTNTFSLIVPLYQPPVQITLVLIVISHTSVNDVTLIKKTWCLPAVPNCWNACQPWPSRAAPLASPLHSSMVLRQRLWSQTEH